jgi:ribosome maturation factor RimP
MITKNKISKLVEDNLEGTDRFVVEIKVSVENLIQVFIDSDTAVTIDHCVELSRYIENNLDRDIEDFELRVMSSGADRPFYMPRQYKKNIGRKIDVFLNNDKSVEGLLTHVDENGIELEQEKTILHGKIKKVVKGEKIKIPFTEIKYSKVLITF